MIVISLSIELYPGFFSFVFILHLRCLVLGPGVVSFDQILLVLLVINFSQSSSYLRIITVRSLMWPSILIQFSIFVNMCSLYLISIQELLKRINQKSLYLNDLIILMNYLKFFSINIISKLGLCRFSAYSYFFLVVHRFYSVSCHLCTVIGIGQLVQRLHSAYLLSCHCSLDLYQLNWIIP